MSNLQELLSVYCSNFKTRTVIDVLGFDFNYVMGKLTHQDWMCRTYSFASIKEAEDFVKNNLDALLEIPF